MFIFLSYDRISPMEENKETKDPKAMMEALKAINKKKDKKTRNSAIMGAIMIIALTVTVILLITNFTDIEEIKNVFVSISYANHWPWLLAALGLMVIYLFLWPMSLMSFSRDNGIIDEVGRRNIFRIGTIEQFYNNVTPFAFGGQPMEVYLLKECGTDTGKATGAVLATFVVHVIASNIFAIIALFFYPYYMKGLSDGSIAGLTNWLNPTAFTIIVIIGYFNNLLTVAVMFALGLSKKVRNLLVKIISKIASWKPFRKLLANKVQAFEEYCDRTQIAFKEIIAHKKAFFKALAYRLIADLAFYSIPFFLLLSVGVEFGEMNPFWIYILVMFGTSFAITSVVWVPTPGTTGAIDYAFAVVMASLSVIGLGGSLFASDAVWATSQTISLLWRAFTYYLVIVFGLIISIVMEISMAKKQMREIKKLQDEAALLSSSQKNEEMPKEE